jgi:kynureninase
MPVDAGVLASLPAQLATTTPEQASAVLDALQAQGVISDYQLPARSQLPPLPQLITIRVGGIEP